MQPILISASQYKVRKTLPSKKISRYKAIQAQIDELRSYFSLSPEDQKCNELINEEIVRLNKLQYKIDPAYYGAIKWEIT